MIRTSILVEDLKRYTEIVEMLGTLMDFLSDDEDNVRTAVREVFNDKVEDSTDAMVCKILNDCKKYDYKSKYIYIFGKIEEIYNAVYCGTERDCKRCEMCEVCIYRYRKYWDLLQDCLRYEVYR